MATLFLRRIGNALHPAAEGGEENTFARTWKDGDLLLCEVKKPRSLPLHRKAFILLSVVYPHTNYPSQEALRMAMTIGAGYVEPHINPMTGETVLVPRSWKFEKMTDDEFRALYNAMIGVALNLVADSTREDWEFAVDEIAKL